MMVVKRDGPGLAGVHKLGRAWQVVAAGIAVTTPERRCGLGPPACCMQGSVDTFGWGLGQCAPFRWGGGRARLPGRVVFLYGKVAQLVRARHS
jgi:hypothetical protein